MERDVLKDFEETIRWSRSSYIRPISWRMMMVMMMMMCLKCLDKFQGWVLHFKTEKKFIST